jgi:hypothetical protein
MSCNFSLFLFRISLYILQIYGVFINRVLQGFINLLFICEEPFFVCDKGWLREIALDYRSP